MTSLSKRSEKPIIFEIDKIVKEAKDINTYWLEGDIDAKPGQFVMVWIPGVDLKPFGISYKEEERFAMTIRKVGPFSSRIFDLKKGDRIGIQGPYGRGFSGKGKTVALVGGGYGTAPLGFLADESLKSGKNIFFITGAVTKDCLLFRERFKSKRIKMIFSTDDGSFGHSGLCTGCLTDLLSKEKIDYVYCCGPEKMMVKVFEICEKRKIPAEFSLERYMKCGFGVCGTCCLDGTGWRVCRDGPVFTLDELKRMAEFGKYRRDATGKRVEI